MAKVHPFVRTDLNDVWYAGIPICEKKMLEMYRARKLADYDADLHFKSSVVTILKQYHGVITEIIETIEKMKG